MKTTPFLSILCVAFLPAGTSLAADVIDVSQSEAACASFIGFGAQWDSAAYDDYEVSDQDFEVIANRIRWMRTPIVRIMMLSRWCCIGDGILDFNTREMQVLYRHLNACQQAGIDVMLTDWGCEREWTKVPGVQDTADPAFAEIIGDYMAHLLNEKGYSCIKYFVFVNEPNYEIGNFDRWKQGLLNVAAAFKKRGLESRLQLVGSDESNAPDWHHNAVDQLKDTLAVYDVHLYAGDAMVRPGQLETFFKEHWDYALANDPNAKSKPMIVGEAGLNDDAVHPGANLRIDTFFYGLFMADYAVQAARAGSAAVSAWQMDDNGHKDFQWGLWDNNAKGLRIRPWFYPWSLLCRYFPKGATIYRPAQPSPEVRILAASLHATKADAPQWTCCVVNRGDTEARYTFRVPNAPKQNMQQFVYLPEQSPTTDEGFPKPAQTAEVDLAQGVELVCAPGSVLVATTLPW